MTTTQLGPAAAGAASGLLQLLQQLLVSQQTHWLIEAAQAEHRCLRADSVRSHYPQDWARAWGDYCPLGERQRWGC